MVELAAIVLAAELIILLEHKDCAAAEVTAIMIAAGGKSLLLGHRYVRFGLTGVSAVLYARHALNPL